MRRRLPAHARKPSLHTISPHRQWNSRIIRYLLVLLAAFLLVAGFNLIIQGAADDEHPWHIPFVVVHTALAPPHIPIPSPTVASLLNPLSILDPDFAQDLESESEEPEDALSILPAEAVPQHQFLPNGLLLVNPLGRHPIYDLIERAEQEWAAKLERQSKTLEEAAQEYHRRYYRRPPRGFDKWWAYVQEHNVQLPDEYDPIMEDLAPFFAYHPRDLRAIQSELASQEGHYTLTSDPSTGLMNLTSYNFPDDFMRSLGLERARAQLELLRGYDERLGEGQTGVEKELVELTGGWNATFSSHDGPQEFKDWEFYGDLLDKAEDGEYAELDETPEMEYRGWGSACSPMSPLHREHPDPPPLPLPSPTPKSFIHSHKHAMNPCAHPSLVHTVGTLSGHQSLGPGPQERRKFVLSMCKTDLHGDVRTVPSEHFVEDPGDELTWAEKKDERLVWRGTTTGILQSPETPWLASHRIRLITHFNANNGTRLVLPPSGPRSQVRTPKEMKAAFLNPILADVAYTKGPLQCREGVCEEMEEMFDFRENMGWGKQWEYKYLLDIDGNGWSARFKRLMTTNSLVLKSTIFPEWYVDRIAPWVHYVPIKVDYTDLYDVMTFFRGDVSRGGEGGHDDIAEKIATQGKVWSQTFWRKEDMVAYTYRLFLEYARLVSDERERMNFVPPPRSEDGDE